MKMKSAIRELYREHYKKLSEVKSEFNTHGFEFEVELENPDEDALDKIRGHYVLARIFFKKLVVGIVHISCDDAGKFLSYNLYINNNFKSPLNIANASSYFSVQKYEYKIEHEKFQKCIDEVVKVRSKIIDFYI